ATWIPCAPAIVGGTRKGQCRGHWLSHPSTPGAAASARGTPWLVECRTPRHSYSCSSLVPPPAPTALLRFAPSSSASGTAKGI
ncbi:hypothetical protein PIB30_071863, partial [Stylosanthes scabra]|nr:hypothetical protein [Stylosanthes scabra]